MFKLDSPLMNFLNKVCDVMIINILVLICSLPIFTMGAAITAAYYMCYKMVKNEEGYIVTGFFKAFKENFKQSTIIWLIMLLIAAILIGDYKIILDSGMEFSSWIRIAILTATGILSLGATFIFPVQARFSNSVKNTMKNGFLMALSHMPSAILCLVSLAIPFVIIYFVPQLAPAVALLAFGALPYGKSFLFLKIFRKYEIMIEERMANEASTPAPVNEDEGLFTVSDAMEKEEQTK